MFTYKSLLTVLFYTFFLYSNYFGYDLYIANTIFALMALASLFLLSKKELFISGFFISVLWFWWIGYSFVYYDLIFLIPIIIVAIGCIYGVLFYLIGLSNNFIYKFIYIVILSYINPFGFNWFKLELLFVNSYFGISKIEFILILLFVSLFLYYKDKYKRGSFILFFVSLVTLYIHNISNSTIVTKPKLEIVQYNTKIKQNEKWERDNKQKIVMENFLAIQNAIDTKKDLIILPETAFPLLLNRTKDINNRLLELSYKISIVTGSLYEKDGLYYNSTYFYENGKVKVAHKVVLVPFGEAVPFPEKIRNLINDLFYNGAKDYETAKKPTTFIIQGIKFRSAICYEATTDDIYEDLDTPYIIAISNNAWFTPSIQPTLQKMLMKYYKKKYNLYYLNVTNY
ncbi:MAG: apolipoprotein N-acyltransferase [Arcobacter sp.]|nr:MAG: apolipoprotein N-acyltransferase [Arcobacter sp.]